MSRFCFLFCAWSCAVSVAVLAGCGLNAPESTATATTSSKTASSQAAPKSPAQADRALSAWIEAVGQKVTGQTAPASTGTKTKIRPLVYIDMTAIARRHPAWKLANDLEQKQHSDFTVVLAKINAPQSPQNPQVPRAPLLSGHNASTQRNANTRKDLSTQVSATGPTSAGQSQFSAQREVASWLAPLQNQIVERQDAALSAFLSQTANWQESERGARAADLHGALEERIAEQMEAAERELWSSQALQLPSPEVQLEMTNLRLQLSNNITMTQAQRAQTQARLQALEEEWRRALQDVESARNSALERARLEEPARMRSQGQQQIDSARNQWQEQDAAQRKQADQNQQALLQQDFALARFGIVLPSYQLPRPRSATSATSFSGSASASEFSNLSETLRPGFPSMRAMQQAGAPDFSWRTSAGLSLSTQKKGATQSPAAKALRQRAWNESWRWVGAFAKQKGWHVVTRKSTGKQQVDGTAQVLQQLRQN